MAATASLKKSPSMKECMAQADLIKEANTVKKMSGRYFFIYLFSIYLTLAIELYNQKYTIKIAFP